MRTTEKVAKDFIKELNNACGNCQEFDCYGCKYKDWRGLREWSGWNNG